MSPAEGRGTGVTAGAQPPKATSAAAPDGNGQRPAAVGVAWPPYTATPGLAEVLRWASELLDAQLGALVGRADAAQAMRDLQVRPPDYDPDLSVALHTCPPRACTPGRHFLVVSVQDRVLTYGCCFHTQTERQAFG